jgi:hypothetical protein
LGKKTCKTQKRGGGNVGKGKKNEKKGKNEKRKKNMKKLPYSLHTFLECLLINWRGFA